MRWNLMKIDMKQRKKVPFSFHLLTHCFFSVLLYPFSSLCDWSELPVWPGSWSQHITSHFVSHNSQLLELAARLCMHPVRKPAAEGISKHCLGAKETKNNSTIWFFVRIQWEMVEMCALTLTYFHHSAILAHATVVQCYNKNDLHSALSSETKSVISYCSTLPMLSESISLSKQSCTFMTTDCWPGAEVRKYIYNIAQKQYFVLWYLLNSGK